MSTITMKDLDDKLAEWMDGQEVDREATHKWISEVEAKAGRKPLAEDGERKPNLAAAGLFLKGRALRRPDLVDEAYRMWGVTKASMQEDTAAEGGYLVPTVVLPEIMGLPASQSVARQLARRVPMTSSTTTVPNLATEPSVAIVSEEATIGAGEPTIAEGVLTAKKLAAMFTVSHELVQDSAPELGGALLESGVAKLFDLEDAQLLEGDGTGTNFTGLIAASGVNTVAVSAALADLDCFSEAIASIAPRYTRSPSFAFVMHPALWDKVQILRTVEYSGGTEGAYRGEPFAGPPRTIWGVPVLLSDQISITGGGSNDTTAYLGDFRQSLMGDREQVTMMADPYSNINTAQIRFRLMERIALLISVPAAFCTITSVDVS